MPRANRKSNISAGTNTPAADPLVKIGQEIWRLSIRYDDLDILQSGAEDGATLRTYATNEQLDTFDRIETLQSYASTMQARSLEGAIVQLSIASRMFDKFEDDEANRTMWRQRFHRLMWSAVEALADLSPTVEPAELGTYYSMGGEHMNPWRPHEWHLKAMQTAESMSRLRGEQLRDAA